MNKHNFEENLKYLDEYLNIDKSFDIGKRLVHVGSINCYIYYVTGLVSQGSIIKILTMLMQTSSGNVDFPNRLPAIQLDETSDLTVLSRGVLSGLIGIVLDNQDIFYTADLRKYPGREPSEPDTEKVVRGSRDGYTENIIVNLGLTRRRIRTGALINEMIKVGKLSKTDVSLTYIKDIASEELINNVRNAIKNVHVEELCMADKALEEVITNSFNPYPIVRYTERPDIVSTHLYQGHVAIFVDNSPSVMLAPTTFFDHLSHAEEYRQAPLIGTFLRVIRLLGIFLSIFLIPLWLLFGDEHNMLSFFPFMESSQGISLFLQIIIATLGVELLRMASIHTPNSLSTAMGIIAAILLGDIAISLGFFNQSVVLFVAVSQIGFYSTPSYEISLANKLTSVVIIFFTYYLGIYGFSISTLSWLIYLGSKKSFGYHYLYPLYPFRLKELVKTIIRLPKKEEENLANKKE